MNSGRLQPIASDVASSSYWEQIYGGKRNQQFSNSERKNSVSRSKLLRKDSLISDDTDGVSYLIFIITICNLEIYSE